MSGENNQILSNPKEKSAINAQSSAIITTQKKEKDPKRVEAGKRLAQISREAKEAKKKKLEKTQNKVLEQSSWISWSKLIPLTMIVGVSVAYFLFYWLKYRHPVPKTETPVETPKKEQKKEKRSSAFLSLD